MLLGIEEALEEKVHVSSTGINVLSDDMGPDQPLLPGRCRAPVCQSKESDSV